jgi:aquaporin Z
MLLKLLTEFIGTFIFLSVILVSGEAIPIAIALAAVIFFAAKISGANVNPAISIMMFAKGDMDMLTTVGYIIAQVLGGLVALVFYKAAYGSKVIKA